MRRRGDARRGKQPGQGAGRAAITRATAAGTPGPHSWWYAVSGSGGMRIVVCDSEWAILDMNEPKVNGVPGPYSMAWIAGHDRSARAQAPWRSRACPDTGGINVL